MSDDGLDLGRIQHRNRCHREPQEPLVEREGAVEARNGDTCVIKAQNGHPGARLRIADLALPSGGVLELIQYELPDVPPVSTSHTQAGTAHIALQVAGLRELFGRLAAAGVDLISSRPVEITGSGEFAGVVVAYLRDPDGNVIELIERPTA